MSVWYTEDRIRVQHEVGMRRMARYERRIARLERERRKALALEKARKAITFIVGFLLVCGYVFASCMWAAV